MSRTRRQIDFLGIGAQKTATSWLWFQLQAHPGIWMPPLKELHYFDRSPRYPTPSHLDVRTLPERLKRMSPADPKVRARFWVAIKRLVRRGDPSELRWWLRYYPGPYDDDWYRSLFEAAGDRITGEITPSYSILEPEDVAPVHALFPGLRILFLVRNPIDRAWSAVRFSRTHGWNPDSVEKIKRYIDGPRQTLRGDYLRTLRIWSSFFPRDQIFVGFYDDVKARPQALLTEIFRFLGVEEIALPAAELTERHNVSDAYECPAEVRLHLARKYLPDLRQLGEELGGHATAWAREAEEVVRSAERDTATAPSPDAVERQP